MLCLPPALLLILVMCLASLRTFFVSGTVVIVGFILYPILVQAKNKKWLLFEAEQLSSLVGHENKDSELLLSSPLPVVEEELSLMQSDSKP
ncbi:amino acid permease-like protein, partial [Trifolium medium]|nr:amino acid permease-like protein [Trifolium medium]